MAAQDATTDREILIPESIDGIVYKERDRSIRFVVFVASWLIAIFGTGQFLGWLAGTAFGGAQVVVSLGTVIGWGVAVGAMWGISEKFFIIRNDTINAFITQDSLSTLLGGEEKRSVNIPYGPGTHISFPWERRIGNNNISLAEVAFKFTFKIQLPDGTIFSLGSFRYRPDPYNLVTYLGSVSSVADDLRDIIVAKIMNEMGGLTLLEAVTKWPEVNTRLEFVRDNLTGFEQRYGIMISDITIGEVLPSEELQRTISAISEARSISEATEELLGMSLEDAQKRVDAKEMTQADIETVRRYAMSLSGNFDGIDISRNEIDLMVNGISPEMVEAIRDVARSPAAQAAAGAYAAKNGKKKKKEDKS